MELSYEEKESYLAVTLNGRLDAVTSPQADQELKEILAKDTKQILLNLAGLDYISSAGLRILLVSAKTIKQQAGKLVLCQLQDGVKEVFEISGFTSIFEIADSEEDAVAQLS